MSLHKKYIGFIYNSLFEAMIIAGIITKSRTFSISGNYTPY